VALKEAGETDYWLNVMIAGGDLEEVYKTLEYFIKRSHKQACSIPKNC